METIIIFSNNKMLKQKYKLDVDVEGNKENPKVCDLQIIGDAKQFVFSYDGLKANDLEKITEKLSVGKVYILYHQNPNEEILTELRNKIKKKGITNDQIVNKMSNHNVPTTYGILHEVAAILKDENGQMEMKLNQAFEKLKFSIAGNPKLESLIHLHKTLSIKSLKNELPNINVLKNGDNKYKLAFELWDDENDINELEINALLAWTSKIIPKISGQS